LTAFAPTAPPAEIGEISLIGGVVGGVIGSTVAVDVERADAVSFDESRDTGTTDISSVVLPVLVPCKSVEDDDVRFMDPALRNGAEGTGGRGLTLETGLVGDGEEFECE